MGTPPGVDVLDEHELHRVERLAGAGTGVHDGRIGRREVLQLLDRRRIHHQPVVTPEHLVIAEHLGERQHESRLEVDRTLAVHHTLDPPRRIDDAEELADVRQELDLAHVLGDLVHVARQLHDVTRPGGANVRVQHADHLDEGGGRDKLTTTDVLLPAHPPLEDEVLATTADAHVVERSDGRVVVVQVAQRDVRAQLDTGQVENLETLPFPLLGLAEVDQDTDVELRIGRGGTQLLSRGDPLQAIHDEDGVQQAERPLAVVSELLASHAEFDVRHRALAQRGHQLADLHRADDLALVVGDLQEVDRPTVDHTPQYDVAVGQLVQSRADDLDAVHNGLLCMRRIGTLEWLVVHTEHFTRAERNTTSVIDICQYVNIIVKIILATLLNLYF